MIARSNPTLQIFARAALWGVAIILALFTANALTSNLTGTIIVAGIVLCAVLVAAKPKLGLMIIVLLPALGEFGRLAVGPENGALISDIFIPMYLVIWLGKKLFANVEASAKNKPRQMTFKKDPLRLWLPLALFAVIAGFSLVQSLLLLSAQEVVSSSLYLIRYLQYALLYFVTFETINSEKDAKDLTRLMIFSAVLIAIAGFIQLMIYPDLADLEEAGWDPHINRLVATWLDPNFVGGLLAMVMTLLLGIMTHEKSWVRKGVHVLIIAILGVALFLTYSRSAYVALAVGIFVVSVLKSRKILVIALALFLLGITFSDRARERVEELGRSVTSIVATTSETPDPTARLRLQSWEQSLQLFYKRPLFGSGFNTLRYVNYREGFVTDTKIHSASGSDSTLLTILATTGIAGLITFLALHLKVLAAAFQNFRRKKIAPFLRGYSLGMFAAILGLFVHSIFVNSLLFPQILCFLWPQIGLLVWIKLQGEQTIDQTRRTENS